jgi:dihydroorotase
MRLLIKSVLILDSHSSFFNQNVDLLIQDGYLIDVSTLIDVTTVDQTIEVNDLSWYPSLVDCRVHSTLPGGEHLEDWNSLSHSASRGGVLDVLLLPTATSIPQTAESIEYILNKVTKQKVNFYPCAPLTLDNKGENFSELLDLAKAGANWFSHGAGALDNTDLMLKSLQYLLPLEVCVISQPDTTAISLFGQVHDGLQSTLLGLKGVPSLSETLSIKRDLDLLRYVLKHSFGLAHPNFRLHFSCISCAESVELLRIAKKEGLPISCDVSVHHLIFNENSVSDFSTNKKVFPPFRTELDRLALWDGMHDQTIDFVVSDHNSIEIESKEVEFDHAAFGTVGLETLFIAFLEEAQKQNFSAIDEVLSYRPANFIKKLKNPLEIGSLVKGILVGACTNYELLADHLVGKSKNSTFIGHEFNHHILAVINQAEITKYHIS